MKIKGSEASLSQIQAPKTVDGNAAARKSDEIDRPEKAGLDPAAHAPSGGQSPVQLSPRVAEVNKIAELARAEPEFRSDVVAQARADLEAGRMKIDASSLAELISHEMF